MRFKFELADKNTIKLESYINESISVVHSLLGKNNKWHDLEKKPFTCSSILGGEVLVGEELKDKIMVFKKEKYVIINTEDDEVINSLMENNLNFEIENQKVFIGYNLLKVNKVIYNKREKGKKKTSRLWINEDNKSDFCEYVKNKYCVDIEILKFKNRTVTYKKEKNEHFKMPITDLLIKCNGGEQMVKNLFESGIGGSCSLGFGFVEQCNNAK